MTKKFTPAQPLVSDMLNARAQVVYRKPYGAAPIVADVTITEVRQYRGITYFELKPDASHLNRREMSEFEFTSALIHYLPRTTVAEVATPAA